MKPVQILLFICLISITFFACQDDDEMQILPSPEPTSFNNEIESIEGQIEFLEEAPGSVELDVLVSDTLIFMFAEKMNHVLLTNIITDMSSPGDYFPDSIPDEEQTWEALNPGVIPAGTKVNSYYFHYDNETYNDNFELNNYLNCIGQYQVNAKVTFKNPVLGIVMRAGTGVEDHLRTSDLELGHENVDYCEHNLSHFPGINIADGCQSDQFVLSADRRTLTLKNNTDIHHDNYRVIVEAD